MWSHRVRRWTIDQGRWGQVIGPCEGSTETRRGGALRITPERFKSYKSAPEEMLSVTKRASPLMVRARGGVREREAERHGEGCAVRPTQGKGVCWTPVRGWGLSGRRGAVRQESADREGGGKQAQGREGGSVDGPPPRALIGWP